MSTTSQSSAEIPHLGRYHTIRENWQFSSNVLHELKGALALHTDVWKKDAIVAVAGSLGRLEASGRSDIDCIVISKQLNMEVGLREVISAFAKQNGLDLPKKDGVFSHSARPEDMVNDIGGFTEDLGILGRRMLLLLESKPVYNEEGYEALISEILTKYAEFVIKEKHKQFVFLLNDLIRYFRAICVNYQNNFWRENEKWPLRNIKLRHSRVVMYAGLLFTLGSASAMTGDRYEFVRDRLKLTPLERISASYMDCKDDCFFRVAGTYDIFLSRLSNSREELMLLDYDNRYDSKLFSELKSNSDALIAELLRFIMAQRGRWSDRFFEYLIF